MGKSKQKPAKNKTQNQSNKSMLFYGLSVFFFSFLISGLMSIVSQSFLSSSDTLLSFLILFVVIAIGVVFDIVGIAVTTCNPVPFHSMAAKKDKYASYALKLIRKAPFVATVSQDVVGDISGVISGVLIASIAFSLVVGNRFSSSLFLNVFLSSVVAGLTVGGKAICKNIAIKNSKHITFFVAKFLYHTEYYFTFKWMRGHK